MVLRDLQGVVRCGGGDGVRVYLLSVAALLAGWLSVAVVTDVRSVLPWWFW